MAQSAPFLLQSMEVQNMECWICGKKATETLITESFGQGDYYYKSPSKHYRCYCSDCAEEVKEQRMLENAEYVLLKKKQMFENALANLETQHIDMYKLKPAIEKVYDFLLNNPDKFDSSYEIMAAIVLINAGIKFQMQKRVLRYQVDIYIPSHKILVEIDGERHKSRKDYDNERDNAIIDELGYDWQIVRISTEHLDKNAMRLITAIEQVANLRRTGKVNWRKVQKP